MLVAGGGLDEVNAHVYRNHYSFYFVSLDAVINGRRMTSRPVFKMFKEGTS